MLIFVHTSFRVLRFRAGIWLMNRKVTQQEMINGMKPVFMTLPRGWIPPMRQDMNQIWKHFRLKGMKYFTFGGPKHIFSRYAERSNPYSRFYQAWVGIYVIEGEAERFGLNGNNIEELGKLAQSDQVVWLRAMGDTMPEASWTGFIRKEKMTIDGLKRPCFEGTIVSHSDLTGNKNSDLVKLLGMPPRSEWEDEFTPHHRITLKGIYGWWYSDEYDVTVVYYGCGFIFETRSGENVDYYREIFIDLVRLLRSVTFVSVEKT